MGFLKSLLCACPYTMLARTLVRWGRLILGREDARREIKDRKLVDGVTMGRNIALIGFFCPFFWFSLFGGADAATIRFNAMHSGAFVIVGLLWMLRSLMQIERKRREGSVEHERTGRA